MTAKIIAIAQFAQTFQTELYDTGYATPMLDSGATDDTSQQEDMLRALYYVAGYADACRLACPYKSPSWHIAHLVSVAAKTLADHLRSPHAASVHDIEHAIAVYRAELTRIIARAPNASHSFA